MQVARPQRRAQREAQRAGATESQTASDNDGRSGCGRISSKLEAAAGWDTPGELRSEQNSATRELVTDTSEERGQRVR